MRNIPMVLLLASAMAACSGNSQGGGSQGAGGAPLTPSAREDVGETVAKVGEAVIGSEDFKHQVMRKQPADGKAFTDEERVEIVEELVTEEVLFQEALKKGLYQDSKVRKILVNLLLREDVYAGVTSDDFTDEDLQAYYESHKDEFVVPEKVQVKRILVRVTPERDDAAAKARADEIFAELKRDRRVFAEVAAQSSDGPYKRRGGDIGFISREGKPGLDADVVTKAFDMKVDELGQPFKSGDAYHLLWVVNRRDRVERSFEQMKGSVVRMVKQERYKSLTDEYIAAAKAKYDIDIDEAKLKAIEVTRSNRGPGIPSRGPAGPGEPSVDQPLPGKTP